MQEFYAPPKIVTGDGCAGTLGQEAAAFGAKRALIVTDKILAEEAFGNQRLLKNNPRTATMKDLTGILEHVAAGPPC